MCNADILWVSKPTTDFDPKAEQGLIEYSAMVLVKQLSEVRSTNMIISEGLSSFSSDYMTQHWRMSV